MDLKIPWKALSKQDAPTSKWGAFSLKQIAFFAIVGLAVIAGIVLRFGQFLGQPDAEQNAPVTVAAPVPAPPVAATPPTAVPTPPTVPTPPVQTTESQATTPPPAQEPATPDEQAGEAAQ